ncbi:sensor histidine kinase [Rhizohabitans arisaemae]|uniref:sensor histidine kinase n=1 Tax=Rhizohabitans arisaemae TaxID=2720610 RepID=UPI0024B0ECB6|nr:histidine kinase [Rhizohabitans arisaemae]
MSNAATSLWAAVRHSPPHGRRDWALAAIVMAGVVLEGVFRHDLVWRSVAVAFGCGLALAALVRRTHPLAAVAFAFGGFASLDVAMLVAGAEPMALHSGWTVLVLVYSLLRWRGGRDAVLGLAVVALAITVIVGIDFPGVAETIAGAALVLLAAALGVSSRYRAAVREQRVEQAKLQEREQLARELHDTVAHHVSAIAIQAQAGLFLARSSSLSGATESLETIDREAARTLAEMRTMVSALRDRERQPATAPQRRIADIEHLVTGSTDALRIGVRLRGDLTNLPPAVEGAVYRVTQESITNATRHAHQATRVEVEVTGGATEVRLTVSDDGARTAPAGQQSGFGLVGMTERVTLLGGTLTAGPNPDRGWSVRAVLPRGIAAP